MRIELNGNCFACGRRNPHGLQLVFTLDRENRIATTVTSISRRHIGWEDAVHGGITATLLDETMVYACGAAGTLVVTAKLSVRYRKPVPIETPLHLTGRVVRATARAMTAKAELRVNGVVHAEGEGLFGTLRHIDDIEAYFNPVADNAIGNA